MPKPKSDGTKKLGRPQKKTPKEAGLPENWKDIIILASIDGETEVEIRARLMRCMGDDVKSITNIWYALKERESEFQETVKKSKILCEAWWIKRMKDSHGTAHFHVGAWIFAMKNLFRNNWKDRVEIDHGLNDESFEKLSKMQPQEMLAYAQLLLPQGNLTEGEIVDSKPIDPQI